MAAYLVKVESILDPFLEVRERLEEPASASEICARSRLPRLVEIPDLLCEDGICTIEALLDEIICNLIKGVSQFPISHGFVYDG